MKIPDGYEIRGTLGQGGMGVVYRAHQSRLQREVALKCIRSEGKPSAAFLERFRREALALTRVSHPNLVKLYDVSTGDDVPYIAMELIEGRPLEQLLRDNPVEVRRNAHALFRQILDAMVLLHSEGLAHRDLKPANIMVTPDWRPVVMDLGLVKDFAGDGTAITGTGTLIGTPAYLAPEVVTGAVAGACADVWALGCIYFAMNAGVAPFRGSTLPDLYRAITTAPMPDLDITCADLPAPRRAFLLQLLERRPERRPPNAKAVLDILRGAVGQSRPVPRLSTGQVRAAPRPRTVPLALGGMAVVAVLAIALLMRKGKPVDLVASAVPVGPPPTTAVTSVEPPKVDPVVDRRLRDLVIDRLRGRDQLATAQVVNELMHVPGALDPARGKNAPTSLGAAAKAAVLGRQRRIAERWMDAAFGIDLSKLVEAAPRWLSDPDIPEETKYRLYRALNALSSLDNASEMSAGGPLINVDALVEPYVRMERGGALPPTGYRPLTKLTQEPVVEMLKSSHLVFFSNIPAEAGLFPENWWDHAQTAIQVLEEPDTRKNGLVWYDLGKVPKGTLGEGPHDVALRVTDLDPAHRVWIRFGRRRSVCFRNTRAFTYRGAQGVELPPKASLESHAVTLAASLPTGFLTPEDRHVELGCDSIVLGTAYNLRYFWLVDLIVRAR